MNLWYSGQPQQYQQLFWVSVSSFIMWLNVYIKKNLYLYSMYLLEPIHPRRMNVHGHREPETFLWCYIMQSRESPLTLDSSNFNVVPTNSTNK